MVEPNPFGGRLSDLSRVKRLVSKKLMSYVIDSPLAPTDDISPSLIAASSLGLGADGLEILLGVSKGRIKQRTMDIDILDREENPMLHRTDVRFQIVHEDASPSRLSVRDSLAAALNKDSDEVVVHKLDTKYGMRKTVGFAKVYETPGHATDVEQEYMLERNLIAADGDGHSESEGARDEGTGGEPEGDTAAAGGAEGTGGAEAAGDEEGEGGEEA